MPPRSQPAPRRRSRRGWLALAAALLLLAVWLAVRGYQITAHLQAARGDLARVSTSQLDSLPEASAAARGDVAAAKSAADDPVWRLAAAVPVAGRSFAVARDATQASTILVEEALPAAARAAQRLRGAPVLTAGTVDLAALGALQPDVDTAAAAAERAATAASATPEGLLPGPLRKLRADLVGQTQKLAGGLSSARTAVALAPGMLGANGPRRYFLAVQNNAETRGTGGLIGAYAVLRADAGRISRERVGTNLDFQTAPAPVVDLGPEFSARYDRDGGRVYWSSAVLTPDWPSASAVMAGLWEAQGGGRIDGVIGVDPLAMADVLAATGPVTVAGRAVDAATVVDFVTRKEYAQFQDDDAKRKQVLSQLAAGLFDQVVAGRSSTTALLQALAKAGGTGHLQIWSSVPAEQQALMPLRGAGALTPDPGAYLQVVMNNAAGNKADVYVRRRVGYERRADGTAQVSVQLTNSVDPTAVPPVVIGRTDNPRTPVEPGATRFIVTIYVGVGQQVGSVQVNGQPMPAQFGSEKGHGAATFQVEVAPSAPTVITAEVSDPGGELVYRQQPLVVNDSLELQVPFRLG